MITALPGSLEAHSLQTPRLLLRIKLYYLQTLTAITQLELVLKKVTRVIELEIDGSLCGAGLISGRTRGRV